MVDLAVYVQNNVSECGHCVVNNGSYSFDCITDAECLALKYSIVIVTKSM